MQKNKLRCTGWLYRSRINHDTKAVQKNKLSLLYRSRNHDTQCCAEEQTQTHSRKQKPRQKGCAKEQTKVAVQKQKPLHECCTKEQTQTHRAVVKKQKPRHLRSTKEQTEDDYVVGRQVKTDRLPLGACAQGTVSACRSVISTCFYLFIQPPLRQNYPPLDHSHVLSMTSE